MPRVIWKGAVSFGLVHVPVALYPASSEGGIDFDWLDKRTMDPVGYKRVNKRTGKEIEKEYIVKGVKQANGDYVILSDEEIKAAYPKTLQTIEIEAFVKAADIPFVHLERPYYLEPLPKGEKVYALLREAMQAQGVIGIARVVMHTKEHLAALIPAGPALMLNTLRWAADIRDVADLKLPAEGKSAAQIKDSELKMAEQLVQDMTEPWQADRYEDHFTEALHQLIEQRLHAGKTAKVTPLEDSGPGGSANVVDLTALLKQSLGGRHSTSAANEPKTKAPAAKKPAAKRTSSTRKRA